MIIMLMIVTLIILILLSIIICLVIIVEFVKSDFRSQVEARLSADLFRARELATVVIVLMIIVSRYDY